MFGISVRAERSIPLDLQGVPTIRYAPPATFLQFSQQPPTWLLCSASYVNSILERSYVHWLKKAGYVFLQGGGRG
jgi:hypothetical protein